MDFKQNKKYIIAIILLLCFLIGKNFANFNWGNWADKYHYNIANNKYSIAILLGSDYHKAWAYNCRGWNYAKKRLTDTTDTYFQKALSDYDNAIAHSKFCYANAIYNKGALYSKINDYNNAIKYYDETISCDSKYKNAWEEKVDNLYNAKRYTEAIEVGKKTIEKFGPNDNVYFDIAYSYEMIGDYKKAIEYYDKELKMNNEQSWWTFTNASYCKLMLKNYDSAIEYAIKATKLWKRNVHPYNFVAFAALKKGNIDLAEQYTNLAFNVTNKKHYLSFYNYAYIKYLKGDKDGAKERLEKARKLFANDKETWQFEGFETLCDELEQKL